MVSNSGSQNVENDFDNLLVLERNREAAHATVMPFPDAASALGTLREAAPVGFWALDADVSGWATMPVRRPS